jgi:purine-binding chemotaxis protein CheW
LAWEAQLTARVSASASYSLLFRVALHRCALPLEHVVETMRPLPLEAWPGASPAAGGFAVVRGERMPILSLSDWFAPGVSKPERFIIVRTAERTVGIAVDEVMGVRELATPPAHLKPLLGYASAQAASVIDDDIRAALAAAYVVPSELLATDSSRAVA